MKGGAAMERYMKVLRNQILKEMNSKDWSITRLSVECGISARELSYILSGKKEGLRFSTLVKISDGIGKPVSFLIGENT